MNLGAILGLIPMLVEAVELLFKGFPGRGAVKKDVVMGGIRAIVGAASGAGVNTAGWESTAGLLIDGYVAVQNALARFTHEGEAGGPER